MKRSLIGARDRMPNPIEFVISSPKTMVDWYDVWVLYLKILQLVNL